MDLDPRSVATLVLLVGAGIYGWLRYYRSGVTAPPQWERAVVPVVVLALVIGLYVWQFLDP